MKVPVICPSLNNDRSSGGWDGENLLWSPDLIEQCLVHGQLQQRTMRFRWDAATAVNALYGAYKSSLRHEQWASGTTLRERNWMDGRRPPFPPLSALCNFSVLFIQWEKGLWFFPSYSIALFDQHTYILN